MEGHQFHVEKSLFSHVWAPGWNSNQAMTKCKGGDSEPWQTGMCIGSCQEGDKQKFEYLQLSEALEVAESQLLAVPRVDLMGTEELSSLAEDMDNRCLEPMIFINEKNAQEYKLNEGDAAKVTCDNKDFCCYVTIDNSLATGVVAISTGVREQPEWTGILPAAVQVEKDAARERKLSNWLAIKGGSLRIESNKYGA